MFRHERIELGTNQCQIGVCVCIVFDFQNIAGNKNEFGLLREYVWGWNINKLDFILVMNRLNFNIRWLNV